jgi:hypothetical protein
MNASERITNHVNELADWRGKLLGRLRKLILEAAPGIVEEWKWNTPVWSLKKNIVAVGAFQDHVKVNFFQGASLHDPRGLFNAGLEAKTTRAIDIHKSDVINESALKELIRAAVELKSAGRKPEATKPRKE